MDGYEKNHRAEHALSKVLEGLSEKQQDDGDGRSSGDLSELALAADTFDHCGLGRTAVDDEASAEGSGGVGC